MSTHTWKRVPVFLVSFLLAVSLIIPAVLLGGKYIPELGKPPLIPPGVTLRGDLGKVHSPPQV